MSYKIPVTDTEIVLNDLSVITEKKELVSTIPMYLTAFSSDKGPEELIEVGGDQFFKLFGKRDTISYKRHGQPLLQAARSVEAGARLLCKRVVATDATLANLTVFAEVKVQPRKIMKTKEDGSGRIKGVYEDPSIPSSEENEFLWDGEGKYIPKLIPDPQNRKSVLMRYFTKTAPDAKSMNEIVHRYEETQTGTVFPLFTITDIGRGVSGKSIRISPSYYGRSATPIMRHTIQVIEDNKVLEEADFTFNPDVSYNGSNIGLNVSVNNYMTQIKCHQYEESTNALYQYVVDSTIDEGVSEKDYMKYLISIDFLFGRDRRKPVEQLQIAESADSPLNDIFESKLIDPRVTMRNVIPGSDPLGEGEDDTPKTEDGGEVTDPKDENESGTDPEKPDFVVVNLTHPNGLLLESGSNGAFGDAPFGTEEYEEQLADFFNGDMIDGNGEPMDGIYDYHNHKIDIIMDANYPLKVKNAIENFVIDYRDDCMYFRDYGLGMNSMQEIEQMASAFVPNFKCADYPISYDIIDPYTNKQIPVTMTYSLAQKMVQHFKGGRHRPCAGIPYNFIFTEAIKGTVSFIPKTNKFSNQRETLTDKRINYCVYYDDKLVLETLFTSQEYVSQLTEISNVLNIQRLIKIIRSKCPHIRYTFTHGKDLDDYKEDIQLELNKESANFAHLEVKFMSNETSVNTNQIHVVVEVACKSFVASELFEINVINLEDANKKN